MSNGIDDPTPVRFLSAFSIDVNTRSDGNRLWTIVDSTDVEPGDRVVVACLEDEHLGGGFAAVVRVHEVRPAKRRMKRDNPGVFIGFDWLAEHSCHGDLR